VSAPTGGRLGSTIFASDSPGGIVSLDVLGRSLHEWPCVWGGQPPEQATERIVLTQTRFAGVIDGGGNVAHHNGDRRQCTHIVCR
jgi:hypothetical protein